MEFRWMKHVALVLVCAMSLLSFVPRVEAGLATSKPLIMSEAERGADLSKVQTVLENKLVQERLAQLGYSQEDIQAKLQGLSDDQLHMVASNIDQLTVGGDAVGFVIGVAILVLIIVAVLYFTNREVVVRKEK